MPSAMRSPGLSSDWSRLNAKPSNIAKPTAKPLSSSKSKEMRVEAQRDVQVELARAIGEFMSRSNMNIFGDSETHARMTEQYAKGLGVGMALAGALSGLGTRGDGKLSEMAQQLMQIAQRIGAVCIPDQNNSSTEQSASTDGDGSPQHSA